MIRSDARGHRPMTANTDCNNMNLITIDVVCEVEKELLKSPYDITSLVFLLYDVPVTALQRLLVYQQVSKDIYSTNQNLLHEWMQVAKLKPTWKHEFLEALLICQLYGIVKKLGFNIHSLKRQYQPDNIHHFMYINQTKKTLYKLCENINTDNLNTLKKTLHYSYKIDTKECDSCELVFLKLMSEKFITLNEFNNEKKPLESDFNFIKLMKLIQKLPGLESFSSELNVIQSGSDGEPFGQSLAASSQYLDTSSHVSVPVPDPSEENHENDDFADIYEMLNGLVLDEKHIKSDSKKLRKDMYPIKDPKKIGVCLIINQEEFYLCDQSIEDQSFRASLANRKGSTLDKTALEKTMSAVNFEVISRDNLNHVQMKDFIKNSVKEKVSNATTSIFMLCIMSHGVRDHVFAADSVKVKVDDIRSILDDAPNLQNIPKVLIIQACRVDDIPQTTLVADSPSPDKFSLRKMDFLVYSATSPEYEAYRDEKLGSIFIQLLCKVIQKKGKQDHFHDICIKANNYITKVCKSKKCLQVPSIEHSLVNNLYLHIPE